jgi:hypothetical protein
MTVFQQTHWGLAFMDDGTFLAINISDSLGNQVGDVGSLVVNELVAAGADDPKIRPVGFAPAGVLVDVVGL